MASNGHNTDAPASIKYSILVSRDIVRITLFIASLNDMDICTCDIGNTYINMKCREKLWTVAGKYFGLSDRVSVTIIARALYGLKSRGAAWSAKLAEKLNYTGHIST